MPELYYYPPASHKPRPLLLTSSLGHCFQQVILQMAMQIDMTSLFLLFCNLGNFPISRCWENNFCFCFPIIVFSFYCSGCGWMCVPLNNVVCGWVVHIYVCVNIDICMCMHEGTYKQELPNACSNPCRPKMPLLLVEREWLFVCVYKQLASSKY